MFGLSSNEIEMTALGFAVQHNFFDEIVRTNTFLNDMTLAFGLIGFTIIALSLGRFPALQIFSWSVLFLIMIVRPIGDPVFFMPLDERNASQLHQTPAMGGNFTQHEFHTLHGNIEGAPTFQQRLEQRGYPQLMAFTPQLAAVGVLNKINIGLSDQFLSPGSRTLDGFAPAIESLKRGRLASNSTNFHLGQFLTVCAADDAGAAQRLASTYIPYSQLERQGARDVMTALADKRLSGWDAWQLLLQYNDYADRQQGSVEAQLVLPPLVCPASGCGGEGQYRVTDSDVVDFVLKDVTARSGDDFIRVRDNREEVLTDTRDYMARLDTRQGIMPRMKAQKLTLAVPLNANAIASRIRFESAADGADVGTNLAPVMTAAAQGLAGGLGCVAGAKLVAGGAAIVGGGATAITGGLAAPVAAVAIGAGGLLGCVGGAALGWIVAGEVMPEVYTVNFPLIDGSGDAMRPQPERVFVVENCADFHRLTDARLFVDTALANRLTDTLTEVLENGDLPPEFSQMSAEQQVQVALHSAMTAQAARCSRGWLDGFSSEPRNITPECEQEAARNISELVTYAQTAAANNALPNIMAAAHARNAQSVRMIGSVRQAMADVGDLTALIGVDLKAIWGGFEAGTYAKIMPFIVSFGTALTIMITPFLYVIGLLVPQWSLSILLIPIVGVVYFQLVKVVFTVVNIMGETFLQAHQLGLLQGSHSKFSDIIMGTAYTMAFILSAGLLFALRNPGAIIQNVAGKADGLSQIHWQEAVAAAYLGQKGVGMVGSTLSGQSWGQLSSNVQNALSGRGGWKDQFKTAEFEGLRKADDMRLTAEQAKLTPKESDESLTYRGNARAIDDINKRADEADKGSLMSGPLRKGRRFAYRDNHGNQRFVDLDAANIALAEVLDKSAPEIAHGREMSRKLLNQKIVVVAELSDGRNVLQVDQRRLQQTSDASIHKYIDQLRQKGHVGSVEDSDTGKTFDDVLVNVKI